MLAVSNVFHLFIRVTELLLSFESLFFIETLFYIT